MELFPANTVYRKQCSDSKKKKQKKKKKKKLACACITVLSVQYIWQPR